MLEINGDYLEGGGQILRTAVSLSCILQKPVRIFNIRAKRKEPGLKSQHLYTLKVLAELFDAETQGLNLGSKEVYFSPKLEFISQNYKEVDLKTAGSIGLALQALVLVSAFKSKGIVFKIRGGSCGLGAIPVDYYPEVVFPILRRSGLEAEIEIKRRGYYPKGGGEVEVKIQGLVESKPIFLDEAGEVKEIKIISIASLDLKKRNVAERQLYIAKDLLKRYFNFSFNTKIEYAHTDSSGSELNIVAYTDKGAILWSDARGELKKTAEEVAKEAVDKLIKEIDAGSAVDTHLADNLISWLSFLGGRIKTGHLSLHTQTNIWVCEKFLGKIFLVKDNYIQKI
ncbi:MAG: RNA 3'-terminal phosphate cyclase [Candidatus Omnitrophica bacterium]|nr:RNA 3'-terminal phosphate cyclase [Candidatus Omnitrophota bacterium]